MNNEDRLGELQDRLRHFVAERDWSQFHNPKNLAMAIASEAGELLAELRWVGDTMADEFVSKPESRQRIEQEVADVGIALLLFCERSKIDVFEAISRKIVVNEQNYPVVLAKGNAQRPPRKS